MNYSAAELDKIKGLHSRDIEAALGYKVSDEIIHRDDLVARCRSSHRPSRTKRVIDALSRGARRARRALATATTAAKNDGAARRRRGAARAHRATSCARTPRDVDAPSTDARRPSSIA